MSDFTTDSGLRVHLLSDGEVADIRSLHAEGVTAAALARTYRVHRNTVVNIVEGRTHKEKAATRG